MSITRFASLALVAALTTATGCATYVNVPEQKADVARNDPNLRTVQQVEVSAIKAVLADRPLEGDYQVVLPELTTPAAYNWVVARLDDHAKYAANGAAQGLPVIEVKYVRVRGASAQADVIRPAAGPLPGAPKPAEGEAATPAAPGEGAAPAGDQPAAASAQSANQFNQLVTVYESWAPFDGWHTLHLRAWRMSVEEALKASSLEYEQTAGRQP